MARLPPGYRLVAVYRSVGFFASPQGARGSVTAILSIDFHVAWGHTMKWFLAKPEEQ